MADAPTSLAQVRFAGRDLTLYGTVTRLDGSGVSLRTEPAVGPERRPLEPGALGEMLVLAKDAVFLVAAHVLSEEGQSLTLRFAERPRKLQRRASQRRRCELPVLYRSVRPGGLSGAWRRGIARDVSIGGMCLCLDAGDSAEDRLDLTFVLPDAPDPIRVTGRVAHRRSQPGVGQTVGVSFGALPPSDHLRLFQFTEYDPAAERLAGSVASPA